MSNFVLSDTPVKWSSDRWYRECVRGHAVMSQETDLSELDACPAMCGMMRDGKWDDDARPCGSSWAGWEIEPLPIEERIREGCCLDWPKPCSYHEGWLDGREYDDG